MNAKNALYSAILNPRSPRYGDWKSILGGEDVPLLSASPFIMELPPSTESNTLQLQSCQAYHLAIANMSGDQRSRLIDFFVGKCGVDRDTVVREIEAKGVPIRKDDIILSFSLRGFV